MCNVNEFLFIIIICIPLFEDIMIIQHYYYQGDGDLNDRICDVVKITKENEIFFCYLVTFQNSDPPAIRT